MLSKKSLAVGSASISATRFARSGITLTRFSRLKVCGSTRSALPAQLLLTTSTSRVPCRLAAMADGANATTPTITSSTANGPVSFIARL